MEPSIQLSNLVQQISSLEESVMSRFDLLEQRLEITAPAPSAGRPIHQSEPLQTQPPIQTQQPFQAQRPFQTQNPIGSPPLSPAMGQQSAPAAPGGWVHRPAAVPQWVYPSSNITTPSSAYRPAPPRATTTQLNPAEIAKAKRQRDLLGAARFALTSENIMKWAGLGLLCFAAIFLVSTAINRGWISPQVQLAGAGAIGFCLHGFAIAVGPKRHHWASAFGHAGSVVVTACAAAAHIWLEIVGLPSGLILVAAAALISAGVALRLRTPLVFITISWCVLAVGFIMNISGQLSPAAMFGWISAVAVAGVIVPLLPSTAHVPAAVYKNRQLRSQWSGPNSVGAPSQEEAISAAFLTRWRLSRTVTTWTAAACLLIITLYVSLEGGANEMTTETKILAYLNIGLVGTALWLGPVLASWLPFAPTHRAFGASTSEPSKQAIRSESWIVRVADSLEHRLAVSLPMWAWLAILPTLESNSGNVGVALAIMFAAAATLTRRWLPKPLFISHIFGASVLLSVAIIVLLDGPVIFASLALHAAASAYVGRHFKSLLLKVNAFVLIGVAASGTAIQLLQHMHEPFAWGRCLAQFAAVGAAFGVSFITRPAAGRLSRQAHELYNLAAWTLLNVYAFSLATLFLDGFEVLLLASAATAASFFVARWLGATTLAFGVSVAGVTTGLGLLGMVAALTQGATFLAHLANFSVVAMLIASTGFAWGRRPGPDGNLRPLVLALTAFTWSASMLWLASSLLDLPQGQLLLSAVWALAAAAGITTGVTFASRIFQVLGMSTLAVVIGKLFTVDLETIDTFWRAGLFFVLGVGFLQLGYRLPKLSQIISSPAEEATTSAEAK